MVFRITLLVLLASCATAATVSDITFVAVEHSSAQIRFVVTGAYTDYRIRYIASPGTCTDGTSGVVNGSVDTGVASPKRVNISGLTSGGVYQVCPEVLDGTWSSGVGATLTLAASPAVSPDPPVAPTDFSTAMPDTAGCTVRAAATCGDIQAQFTAARDAQGTGCSVVTIPAGTCNITSPLTVPSTAEGSPYWVIVRPAVTDAELPPAGVRITPEWASKMATLNLTSTAHYWPFGGSYGYALGVGLGGDTPKKWRFVGIRWTHDDTATSEIATYPTPDPHGFFGWVYMDSTASDIIFDRNIFEGRGYPNRIVRPIVAFEGARSAIIDSYLHQLDWWHSYTFSTVARTDSTHVAVGADQMHNGPDTWTIPATTITITGGTATGRGAVYLDLAGGKHVTVPGDVTATCSGTCTVHQVAQTAISSAVKGSTTTLTVTGHGITDPSARIWIEGATAWPGLNGLHRIAKVTDANTIEVAYWSLGDTGTSPGGTVQFLLPGNAHPTSPRIAALPVGWFEIAAGAVTSAWAAESIDASTLTYEGCSMLVSQKGPGPLKIENNYIEVAGLAVHFDDGCPSCTPADIIFRRNANVTPTSKMFWHADSDNSRYFIRHQFEVKNGVRVLVDGNQFNAVSDVTSTSAAVALTARSGGVIGDIDIRNNTFTGAGGTMLASATDGYDPLSVPPVRSRYENNLMILDAPTYTATGSVTRGWAFYGGYSSASDADIRRNTIYSMSGDDPAFMEVAGTKASGYAATDNFFVGHSPGGIRALYVEQCGSAVGGPAADGGKESWECAFPGGVFAGNIVLATYTETTLCSIWGGTWNGTNCTGGLLAKLIPTGGIASAGFYDAAGGDFHRKATSPLLSGGGLSRSGLGVGADVDELRRAQGTIYNQRNIGTSVHATVPDAGVPCYVDYGTGTDPLAWTRTAANTDATRTRTIVASGLTAGMYFRVVCAGTYQPASVVAR